MDNKLKRINILLIINIIIIISIFLYFYMSNMGAANKIEKFNLYGIKIFEEK